jgi:2',3'-cyclic-nucleotide 2'-phosphodiesterase (5'-nucleotidase family)
MKLRSLLPFLALALLSACSKSDQVRLVIYHTNDVHGWVLPRKASFYKPDPGRMIGGCAALQSFLKTQEPHDLLLDAGDWFQGTPEGGLTKGAAPVDCFNAVGVDAAEIGNHEFDNGVPFLVELLKRPKFPVLAANIYEAKTGKRVSWTTPYVIKDVKGIKVGMFGLLTSNMSNLAFPEHIKTLRFRREADEAADVVKELKAKGAQIIIALTHVGWEKRNEKGEGDRYIAEHVPGIDLIVGGHSHTALDPPSRWGPNGTLIVQAGSYLTRVGKAVLVFDKTKGKVVSARGRLFDLWIDRYGEDPEVKSQMDRYEQEVGRKLDIVIATAAAPMQRVRDSESSIGDWMSDCLRTEERTDAAFQNSGGIRADFASGPLTLRDMYQVMPFDNRVVTLKLTGRQLREVVEHGVSGWQGIIQVSGMRVSYNPVGAPGSRVSSIDLGGHPLKDDKVYSIATSDFLVSGGDGYKTFADGRDVRKTNILLRDVLGQCARRSPRVAPPTLGRLTAVKPVH